MATHTIEDLAIMQGLPLPVKVRMSETRIRQWVQHYGEDGVYISFSGGKDSTVLLDIVRNLYPGIPAVFVNTGLEFPEIQSFVNTFENVEILRPKMRFDEVIREYGYPFISKNVSGKIWLVRSYGSKCAAARYFDEDYKSLFNVYRWRDLLDADFVLSSKCCNIMKKHPAHQYAKQTGRKAFTGQQASESIMRRTAWLKHGCNAFDSDDPKSNPLAFWTEQDVLQYIKERGLPIASVYGDIITDGADGFEYEQSLIPCKYKTTGCDRTGCIFCGYGAHIEKGEGRFQRLKRTHPKQYDYCLGGGGYDPADGLWKPTKEGLGMAHVIDELCRLYGKDFIKY